MGRYGINAVHHKNAVNGFTDNQIAGLDEVDNVMSKMVRPASTVPVKINSTCRRNSYQDDNECTDDDSGEDSILSKSSPAAFSLYSDTLHFSADARLEQNSSNVSNASSHQNLPEYYREIDNSTNSQNQSRLRQKEGFRFSQLLMQILFVVLVGASVTFGIDYFSTEPTQAHRIYDKINFYNDIMNLGEKYKVKDTSLLQVRTGVATIFEKQDTGSFIFTYNSKNNNFNRMIFNSFIEKLAATTARYLRNSTDPVHPVVVDTVNLRMQTEKEFMVEYEKAVAKTGVMLVKDVDNVPSQLAMAFHYYCDEYSPLVRTSAIFFTLNLAKCSYNSDPPSTHNYIEKCLAKKWSSVGEDRIQPLLNRVVNIVVDVTSVM